MAQKARLSAQQNAIRAGQDKGESGEITLYQTHPGVQTEFMLTDAEEVLYGGAAGGGKSYALRAYGVNYCMSYPKAKGVLFRRSFRQLEETHLIAIQQEVPTTVAHYATGSHDLIFPNGSIFMFRFCEQDADALSYDTAEFDFMLFDELTHFTAYQYKYLTHRVRSAKPWWIGPRIRSGATPLAQGHAWVKARFVVPKDEEGNQVPYGKIWKAPLSEGGMTRQFIPAKVTDNYTLMSSDPNYVNRLRALTKEEYQAKALGDWNTFTGQFFTHWHDQVHVVKGFDIPPDWDKFLCVDYGFNAPYAALWFARPPKSQVAYVYREQHGVSIPLDEQVYRAWQATQEAEEKLLAVILDPAMFAKVNFKGERTRPMSDHWTDRFGDITVVRRGNNERVPGWRLMREMIEWQERPDGGVLIPPRLHVFQQCSNTVREIPNLICDEKHPEDIDTSGEDHCADALRYGLRYAFEGNGRVGVSRRTYLGPKGLTQR